MSGSTAIRAAALVTMTALLGACQSDGDDRAAAPGGSPSSAPTAAPSTEAAPPPTAAPSPVTAANTAEVCATVDKLIISKSREISADATEATRKQLTPEEVNAQVKTDLADLADDVRGQAAKAEDPEIKKLVGDTAKQIDAGAKSATPVKWLSSTFVTIPAKLSADCRV
ncbi:hypothetical protein [Micromonospora auratinigra]|uniref:Uncharacterized protein n=1 Tax=Micromonospora auratinigra TaxID=261654 RepID=A0A1A9A531_9ACTN|nr:hypothetical protein [Micromonospora auratinigra]SBT51313.1 hypothetical protein GA0070611_5121 [Micromonospora auratinigra]